MQLTSAFTLLAAAMTVSALPSPVVGSLGGLSNLGLGGILGGRPTGGRPNTANNDNQGLACQANQVTKCCNEQFVDQTKQAGGLLGGIQSVVGVDLLRELLASKCTDVVNVLGDGPCGAGSHTYCCNVKDGYVQQDGLVNVNLIQTCSPVNL
ncbi:hypothetical protein VTJ83DRAFT_6416 [Remersonia thermophila]|uniref:Hydrophobin n=1 Tax=Remersonia thermophila TaxID=72144 RepID=A0ABR4D4M8_9PEZI